jgi:catechol 2,3-dioxygenase-like lactoylglutathione lyase family enzyme
MAVTFNHTIVAAKDREVSARFLVDLLGVEEPTHWGPFTSVRLDEGVVLQYAEPPVDEIQMQHYAFLVSDAEFDQIFGRIKERKLKYWADPGQQQEGKTNTHFGGRGVYFEDPSGHLLEIITRPYGNWPG